MLKKIILLMLFVNISYMLTGQAKEFLAGYIAQSNPKQADFIADRIMYYSQKYEVDYIFVTAVFKNESNFRVDAVSSHGAVGVAQLMPATARELQVDPHQLEDNIKGGIKYLSFLLKRYAHKNELMPNFTLAAYNAGYGAVEEINGIPNYRETLNYIENVHATVLELNYLRDNHQQGTKVVQPRKNANVFFELAKT